MATRSIERRTYRTEVRDVPGSKGRQKWATAVTYNTVDDYGTLWVPGVFDEGLDERMPTILYGHDWYNLDHVLGKGVDKRQTPEDVGPPGVDVLMEFADVEAADLAIKLLDGKVLRDVSVGFERREWRNRDQLQDAERQAGADEAMVKAGMDELSLVVRGAVEGAQVRSRRSGVIDVDALAQLAQRVDAGELTQAQALIAVDLLSGPAGLPIVGAEGASSSEPDAELQAQEIARIDSLNAEADALLTTLGRTKPRR